MNKAEKMKRYATLLTYVKKDENGKYVTNLMDLGIDPKMLLPEYHHLSTIKLAAKLKRLKENNNEKPI